MLIYNSAGTNSLNPLTYSIEIAKHDDVSFPHCMQISAFSIRAIIFEIGHLGNLF